MNGSDSFDDNDEGPHASTVTGTNRGISFHDIFADGNRPSASEASSSDAADNFYGWEEEASESQFTGANYTEPSASDAASGEENNNLQVSDFHSTSSSDELYILEDVSIRDRKSVV